MNAKNRKSQIVKEKAKNNLKNNKGKRNRKEVLRSIFEA